MVAGSQPNFMENAPFLREFSKSQHFTSLLVHTGQHYHENMSGSFFQVLGIKKSDYHLNAGSGTHVSQTANIMIKFEEVCIREDPDLMIIH